MASKKTMPSFVFLVVLPLSCSTMTSAARYLEAKVPKEEYPPHHSTPEVSKMPELSSPEVPTMPELPHPVIPEMLKIS